MIHLRQYAFLAWWAPRFAVLWLLSWPVQYGLWGVGVALRALPRAN